MEKIKLPMPIAVEGKYDKNKLSAVFDGTVITTNGFGIFNDREKLALIRILASENGIIVLTDSDGAGKLIRSHISSAVPKDKIYHLYTPQLEGKEKRKKSASAEGYLGVEGMESKLLYTLLSDFAAKMGINTKTGTFTGEPAKTSPPLTKAEMYADSLTGSKNSSAMRDLVCAELSLPSKMSAPALLDAVNIIGAERYRAAIIKLKIR